MADSTGYRYLPPQMAERLRGLEIAVRRPMDGSHQGLHRSPSFGSSVEFAEYREYAPGDPIGRIDWPVYARSDRYVIRQFHEDVSIRCTILLDTSASMGYRQDGPMSKLEYGCYLAAGLMYAMIQQGDTVSLITFDKDIRRHYEPCGTFAGLRPMLLGLEEARPEHEGNIEAALHVAAEFSKGRSLVVIISDFLQEPDSILRGIHHLYHDGKDVTLLHVLDPAELYLPMSGLVEIVALETQEKLTVDFRQVRDAYLEQMRLYLEQLRRGCQEVRADYLLAETRRDAYDVILKRSRAV
ncbi:MAG: DUF58 domain-containing protein [Planctomycetes bacterium]|jgi:uncharacterized protein (DUF58 family)|nr:DUF58 domain-containing protein [Planctomycetota bacterium]